MQPRDEMIGRVLTWAATQYPTNAGLPPELRRQGPPWHELSPTREEMIALFAGVATRRAHLALVDQPYVRARLRDPAILAAAHRGWVDKYGNARPLGQILAGQARRDAEKAQGKLGL